MSKVTVFSIQFRRMTQTQFDTMSTKLPSNSMNKLHSFTIRMKVSLLTDCQLTGQLCQVTV